MRAPWIVCRVCDQAVKTYAPRGGDGSARRVKYHYRMATTLLVPCEGGFDLIDSGDPRLFTPKAPRV